MNYKLFSRTAAGWYCERGDFYIDPHKPVENAIVTHAHADHARPGHKKYIAMSDSEQILYHRLGKDISIEIYDYEQSFEISGVKITFFPAGHILGSAQIKIEGKPDTSSVSESWIFTGDYKIQADGVCPTYHQLQAEVFVSESTFALPHFNWPDQKSEIQKLIGWWKKNSENNICSIISCYSLGKSQRILSLLNQYESELPGNVFVHPSIANTNISLEKVLDKYNIDLGDYRKAYSKYSSELDTSLVISPQAPLSNHNWLKRFRNTKFEIAKVSGWMQVKGVQRGSEYATGFVISDHCDWEGLIEAITSSKAKLVYLEHGFTAVLERYLNQDLGIKAIS